jgi:fucose permease
MCAVVVYAIGGGIIEVMLSPIVEACPTERKAAAMSLLHSFYCWGHMTVILGTTAFFAVFGRTGWNVLACLWAFIPLFNAVYFSKVPIAKLSENEGKSPHSQFKELFSSKMFWMFALLMVCSGASELAMSQWASAFAEAGLGVSKTMGDLAGPCMFALLMGASRAFHSKYSAKINLHTYMVLSVCLSIVGYLLAALARSPVLGLLGCGLCGLGAGIMWPGTISLAAAKFPKAGTALFALLALGGDLGCSLGPTLVGMVAAGSGLKTGLLVAVIFPVALGLGIIRANLRPGSPSLRA